MAKSSKSVAFWYNKAIISSLNYNGEVGYVKSTSNVGEIVFGDISGSSSLYGKKLARYFAFIKILASQQSKKGAGLSQ